MTPRGLDAIRDVVADASDPDVALRDVVALLAEENDVAWAGIAFVEGTDLVAGPSAGNPDPTRRTTVPICFNGDVVGELWIDGVAPPFVDDVAREIAPHVLLGWDTGGEPWEP